MKGRIIAQADDVVVDTVLPHTVEEVGQHTCIGYPLTVQHDFGIGALLAAGLPSLLQQREEAVPVGGAAVGVAAVGIVVLDRSLRPPKHAVGYLVARLNHVGRGTCRLELLQAVLGIFINLRSQLCVIQTLPGIGRPLLAGIGPGVAVMEVEQQRHAGILDALAQGFDIGKVLTYSLIAVLRRVNKQPDTHGVQPFLTEKRKDILNGLSAFILIHYAGTFVFGQHRDVAAYEWLCRCLTNG